LNLYVRVDKIFPKLQNKTFVQNAQTSPAFFVQYFFKKGIDKRLILQYNGLVQKTTTQKIQTAVKRKSQKRAERKTL